MKQFAKYLPTLGAGVLAVLHFLLPSLNAYTAAHPKTVVGVLLAALVAAYHAPSPGQQDLLASLVQKIVSNGAQTGGKVVALIVCLICLAHPSHAQLTNLYGGGISYNNAGSPSVAGTALFAKAVSDGSGTYAFGVYDALPNSLKPFTVTSNVSAGIAQKVFSLGKVDFYVPTSAGVSFQGSNTGWAWTTGAMGIFKIKGNWYGMPSVRVAKSSVSNGTGYQLIPGILFGWGK